MASNPPQQPLIEIKNLRKVYQTPAGDFTAVNGINVEVQRGEFVAIIGKSGSGKSTFINMITGIDRPTSGEIIINGAPVHSFSEGQMAAWRGRNLGIVFQFFQLFPTLTILENIILPKFFAITKIYEEKIFIKIILQCGNIIAFAGSKIICFIFCAFMLI